MTETLTLVSEWLTGAALIAAGTAIALILRHEHRCEQRQDTLWAKLLEIDEAVNYMRGKTDEFTTTAN